MSGNVWEFCWNTHDRDTYYEYEDIITFGNRQYIVMKGGCWFGSINDYEAGAIPSNRGIVEPTASGDGLGFRVVRSVR